VELGRQARALSVAGDFACAIVGDYDVACWGYNQFGELGVDLTENVGDDELPASAPSFEAWNAKAPVTFLSSGGGRSCVAPPLEEFNCWGNNEDGGLGTSFVGRPEGDVTLSTSVAWSAPVVKLGVGGGHQCTLVNDKNFFCWGLNAKGQLGKAYLYTAGGAPGAVDGIPIDLGKDAQGRKPSMLDFALGTAHTCVLLAGDLVRCWGWNHAGQLGLGFSSAPPIDYVGGDAEYLPLKLPIVKVLPESN
jgi:alpha-tubulin suppressor-like RCC1 family protein